MFFSVLSNVFVMLLYMMVGFALCKSKLGTAAHAKTMSGLLIYFLSPCMIINTFLQIEYTTESFIQLAKFFVATLLIQLLFFLILFAILHKKYSNPSNRILTVGSVLGNVGFIGLPLITGIFPEDPIVGCYSAIFVVSMNLLVFTMGAFLITNDKKHVSIKSALINPSSISLYISLFIFLLKIELPTPISGAIGTLAKTVTPLCMIILGMRLSTAKLKNLLTRPFVYLTCAMKLIVFPLFAYLCVLFLPFFDHTFKVSVFVLAATPCGAIVQSLAELHECEQEYAANVVLMTTLLSVITLPLLMLVVQ